MSSLYILIPVSLVLGLAALLFLLWAHKKAQFDDPEGPKYRMLEDEREPHSGEADMHAKKQ